jgi:predicted RNase H-like HicB family nuclease
MNSSQEAKLNMYHAVITHIDANPAVVTTSPAFVAATTAFKAKVTDIDSTAQLEAQVISGIATDKKVVKASLIQTTLDFATAIYAYAVSINNNTLKERADFSRTDLARIKDDELAPTCNNIRDDANTNVIALAGFGITPAKVTDFTALIDQYVVAVPAPRNAAAQRKTYAATLKTLFKEADFVLKNQMDKIVEQFKTVSMDFYTTYKNNRIILDPAVSNTQAQGTVTIDVAGGSINGVAIQATQVLPPDSTATPAVYNTSTDVNGQYTLKIPQPGVYDFTFKKTGYQVRSTNNIALTLGQTTALSVTLIPNL